MPRNKYPEQTVEKILDAAALLFLQKGYQNTTLQDIIDATKLSKGAVYHHFRSKEEIAQDEALGIKRMNADEELAQQMGESPATIQRYKTLNKLVPELQNMVDEGKIPVNTGADIAQMKPKEQKVLADAIRKESKVPSGTKAKELKKESQAGSLTTEKIVQAVAPTKREEMPPLKVTMLEEDLRPFFPDKRTTIPDVKQGILEGLKLRQTVMERQKAKAAAGKSVKKAEAPVR